MTRTTFHLGVILLLLGFGANGHAPASGAPGPKAVVVELFTSQGCSSCPPADRLLSRLGAEGLPGGVEVIPLSFHVDYWNYIGWTDPFSSEAWSDRQRRYARTMRLDTIYTPQVVVQGGAETVGSNAESVLRAIARASQIVAAVQIDVARPTLSDGRLETEVTARVVGELPDALDLEVALFETRLVTAVGRGENAHRTLENDYVVRRMVSAFEIDSATATEASGRVVFELEPDWKVAHLGVAAFAQDPGSLRIHGAAARTR